MGTAGFEPVTSVMTDPVNGFDGVTWPLCTGKLEVEKGSSKGFANRSNPILHKLLYSVLRIQRLFSSYPMD